MIYKVMDQGNKQFQIYIETNASEEQFHKALQYLKENIEDYCEEDIIPTLEEQVLCDGCDSRL